ncbi:MAG: hypothetical protein M1822_005734 [Bathelium mastoideum]|nr:MAG: hypothetical protein M1822_005734 [Bathelium mastoideum]
MYRPPGDVLGGFSISMRSFPGSAFLADRDTNAGDWSSFIGIITAICGNILISFALNTQRYAHIRLERERDDAERKRMKGSTAAAQDYGTQQEELAQERERVNHNARGSTRASNGLSDGYRRDYETDQLLPRMKNRGGSVSSDSTIRGHNEKQDSGQGQSYLKSPYWWAGLVMITIGEAGNFLAYGFAPASVVSPLGVVALISNCIIAPFMLKERFRARDGLGVLVAVGGAVTVVLSAESSDPKLGPDQIWDLIKRWEFETYLGITLFCIVVLIVLSGRYGEKTILIDLGLVGLFGGYTALSTKGIASLLSYQLWKVITFPVTYLLLAILVFTAIMQVKYVNRALQRFNSTQVIPTQFVMFTLFVILGSAILYRDFEDRSAEDAAKFFGGCALTFLGVWLITGGRGKESEDEELGEGGDVINLVDEERFQNTVAQFDPPQRKPSYASGSAKGFSTSNLPDDKRAPALPRTHSAPEYARSITSSSSSHADPAVSPPLSSTPSFSHDDAPLNPSLLYHESLALPPNPWTSSPSPSPSPSPHYIAPSSFPHHQPPDSAPSRGLPQPPTLNATSSDSILPTRRPRTPPDPLSNANPPSQSLTPQASRRSYHYSGASSARHSLADLFITTPLTAPLSGGLSAVVADGLRHHSLSVQRDAARRRSRSGAAEVESPSVAAGARRERGEEWEDGDGDDVEVEGGEERRSAKARSRSLGDALEGVWRKGKGLRKGLRRGKSGDGGGQV